MGYSIAKAETDIALAVRRIALERLDHAIAELDGYPERHEALHEARKDIKKLRALLRLVRNSFPDYSTENATLRDAARTVSPLRDDTAMIEAFDRLMDRYGAGLDRNAMAPMRDRLLATRDDTTSRTDIDALVGQMRQTLAEMRTRVPLWQIEGKGFDILAGGLGKTLKRARKAMDRARETGEVDAFHDWRKAVKYHGYHVRLLKKVLPEAEVASRRPETEDLGERLGDHHDLSELRLRLPDAGLSEPVRETLDAVLQAEMRRLERNALKLGVMLFAESPKALTKRWEAAASLG